MKMRGVRWRRWRRMRSLIDEAMIYVYRQDSCNWDWERVHLRRYIDSIVDGGLGYIWTYC